MFDDVEKYLLHAAVDLLHPKERGEEAPPEISLDGINKVTDHGDNTLQVLTL